MQQHVNQEIEQSLIGAMLIDQDARQTAFAAITPDDFGVDIHRRLAAHIKGLHESGKPVIIGAVAQDFADAPDLYEAGGKSYIIDLAQNVISLSNTADYAKIVKELANRRALLGKLSQYSAKINGLSVMDDVSKVAIEAGADIQGQNTTIHDGGITYSSAADMKADLGAMDFVQNTLHYGQLSVIYGESNCGKTFFMTDMCFHIASGTPWRGMRTDSGCVVYVSLEGTTGLARRIAAYQQVNEGADISRFIVVPSHVDFLHPDGNIQEFLVVLRRIQQERGRILMVVIDTLARAMSGGDENSSEDMGAIVRHADMIRTTTGAHVSFVHHSGKDKLRGARGHSSLRAAVDTEIEVARPDGGTHAVATVVKQRDGDTGAAYPFTLQRVVIGENPYGEEVSSCVVRVIDEAPTIAKEDATLGPNQAFVYDAIVAAIDAHGQQINTHKGHTTRAVSYDDLYRILDAKGFKTILNLTDDEHDSTTVARKVRDATYTARAGLHKRNLIAFNRNHIWLV